MAKLPTVDPNKVERWGEPFSFKKWWRKLWGKEPEDHVIAHYNGREEKMTKT